MTLQVKPNTRTDYSKHRFNVCADGVPVAYSDRLLTAHRAKIEIQKSLARLDQRLTERANEPPLTPLRRAYWNASRG